MRERLFDVEDTERRVGSTKALVALDPAICPACAGPVSTVTTHTSALFRHGGYGATSRKTTVHCTNKECRWHMEREATEVNPRA